MPIDEISPPTVWAPADSATIGTKSRTPVTTLDQDDFFKLLVAQLTTQDPMKPMDDMEFFSQLSQFSALEQNKAMQANMAVMQANTMLGQEVEVRGEENGDFVTGIVDAVQLSAGTPKLIINGEPYDLASVEIVRTTTNNQTP